MCAFFRVTDHGPGSRHVLRHRHHIAIAGLGHVGDIHHPAPTNIGHIARTILSNEALIERAALIEVGNIAGA